MPDSRTPDERDHVAGKLNPDGKQVAVDDAPQIPGEFGVDSDPYTEDDSQGRSSPKLPEPRENEPDE